MMDIMAIHIRELVKIAIQLVQLVQVDLNQPVQAAMKASFC
jgi:hypothetical protein